MGESDFKELFLFAAKAGSLEGYLFQRRKVEPLTNWIENIGRLYQDLPSSVKKEVNPALVPVLERILEYGAKVLEPGLREKVEQMLAAASAGSKAGKTRRASEAD